MGNNMRNKYSYRGIQNNIVRYEYYEYVFRCRYKNWLLPV